MRSMRHCRQRRFGASSSATIPIGTPSACKEIAALAAENKDDAAIGQQMARALVALRRQKPATRSVPAFRN